MDTFPTCKICQEQFTLKGPAPYLLPCLHAVCEACVTSTAGGVVSCSTCQSKVNLTETHLQKDMVRQREIFHLTVQHRPSELLCTNGDDGNQAACWCQECEELLCEYCQTLHEGFKAMRRHTVKELSEIQPGHSNHEQLCSVHKSCLLDFWDKTCTVLICRRCKQDEHEGHDVEDAPVAANSTRVEIEDVRAQVLLTKGRHRLVVETAKGQLRHATENEKIVKEKINHTFLSLKSCIEQRQKEILLEHDRQTGTEAETLSKTKESSESGLLVSESIVEYIDKALLYLSKYDLLKVKRTIRERSQSCLADRPPEQSPGFLEFEFTTHGLEKLKSSLCCFGQITAVKTPSPEMSQGGAVDAMHSEGFESREDMDSSIGQGKHPRQEVGRLTKHCAILEAEMQKHGIYCLKREDDTPAPFLKCTNVELDMNRVNLKGAFINSNGELSNDWLILSTILRQEREGLQNYEGTCSTFPVIRVGSAQYWETVSKVRVDKALEERNVILEIGLVREEERDKSFIICKQPHSYSLTVNRCMKHKGVCRQFWKHGIHVQCLPDTLANKPGTSVSLHYGVIYDDVRNMVAFLDINENRILAVFNNVDTSFPLWPMFGVSNPKRVKVEMKLLASRNIDITERKKEMILQVLLVFSNAV